MLHWFESFLSGKRQREFVDNEGSALISVESELIQGTTLRPFLFALFLNAQLKITPVPIFTYACDIKLLVEVKANNYSQIQGIVNVKAHWSNENRMPISIEKCSGLHRGCNNLRRYYVQSEQNIK